MTTTNPCENEMLIPLIQEPMSEELKRELEDWQELGAGALEMFPYEDVQP